MRSVPLIVGLVGVLAGCTWAGGGGGDAVAHPAATLRVRIRTLPNNGRSTLLGTMTLGCSPPTGTVTNPVAACAALRDYVSHYRPPNSSCACGASRIGTPYAVVTGMLDGKRVDASLEPCMCGVPQRFVDDLQVVTGLGSFAPIAISRLSGVTRVPREGNEWAGSVVARLYRAG